MIFFLDGGGVKDIHLVHFKGVLGPAPDSFCGCVLRGDKGDDFPAVALSSRPPIEL